MKKLILPLILTTIFSPTFAADISDTQIKNKFLSVVKDVEVEKMIGSTAEFNDCRKDAAYKQGDDKDAKIVAAKKCFEGKLKKDPTALQKLSADLNLEGHGLVKSKNINDITEYLSNKLTKSLTGIDPNEKDPQKIIKQMKWENQKIVDHKVFIDLYTNQLMKNALYEVSRFCFENFRLTTDKTKKDFHTYWDKKMVRLQSGPAKGKPDLSMLDDSGEPEFFTMAQETSSQSKIYDQLVQGLSGGKEIDAKLYGDFFKYCQESLPLLCKQFQDATLVGDLKDTSVKTNTVVADNKMSNGANACLTMERLKSIRTAMNNTEAVAKQFDEMDEGKDKFALQMVTNPQIYQRGNTAGEDSLDKLTSMASTDLLEGSYNDKLKDLEDKCSKGAKSSECDEYLLIGDDLEKTISKTETDLLLKREIQVKIVQELKEPDDLKKYLSDNGHFDLLNRLNENTLPISQIETEIAKIYDARRIAAVEALKLKLGKRQITEDESKIAGTKEANISANITASKEERARLAQVVMFNNIITSQLELKDRDDNVVAQNVSGWNKEAEGLIKSGVNEKLFSGLQADAKGNAEKAKNADIVGGAFIDNILGKKKD